MPIKAPEQTREKLLDAVVSLVLERNSSDFSLEAVAQRAGVSKGGLLHHFRSKDALILGVAQRQQRLFWQRLEGQMAQEPEGSPGRWARAYIALSFEPDEVERHLFVALSGSIGDMTPLNALFEQECQKYEQHSLNDGLPPARAALIRLTCDGLSSQELAGMTPVSPEHREALRQTLLEMTR